MGENVGVEQVEMIQVEVGVEVKEVNLGENAVEKSALVGNDNKVGEGAEQVEMIQCDESVRKENKRSWWELNHDQG